MNKSCLKEFAENKPRQIVFKGFLVIYLQEIYLYMLI